jgi:DNA polymerase III sliding clamp (beta) subunit (PCNA family)
MRVNTEQLRHALTIVKPGLADREIIEQSTSLAFIKGKIITYNDEISIAHPVEGLEEINGAIQADKLYALLNKIKKEEVEIEINNNELILSSGRMKAGLTLQTEIKLPLDDVLQEVIDWKPLPENFVEGVKFVMSSCSKDMSRPILTCIHVNKAGFVEGSDSVRIARYNLSGKIPVKTFLIPASSAVEIVKLNPTQVSKQKKCWISFRTEENTTILCRILEEDEYPDTSRYLEVKGEEIIFPKFIQETLDRACIFAKRDYILDEEIEMVFGNNSLKLRSQSEQGWFEEEIRIRYKSTPFSILIRPYALKNILSESLKCTISKDERIQFRCNDWTYVSVLLIKSSTSM